eukprot:Skav225358  [mRNA]  locus=scaffold652:38678:40021:+ [translate_table: standard]
MLVSPLSPFSPLCLPFVSVVALDRRFVCRCSAPAHACLPLSRLCLPCVSPLSSLCLPFICPLSPLCLPCRSGRRFVCRCSAAAHACLPLSPLCLSFVSLVALDPRFVCRFVSPLSSLCLPFVFPLSSLCFPCGSGLALCLAFVSPVSPLCLPFVSPLSPLCLPFVSPLSPLCLPFVSPLFSFVSPLSPFVLFCLPFVCPLYPLCLPCGSGSALCLPLLCRCSCLSSFVSPLSSLCLPFVSPLSPLCLPFVSPLSSLCLPFVSLCLPCGSGRFVCRCSAAAHACLPLFRLCLPFVSPLFRHCLPFVSPFSPLCLPLQPKMYENITINKPCSSKHRFMVRTLEILVRNAAAIWGLCWCNCVLFIMCCSVKVFPLCAGVSQNARCFQCMFWCMVCRSHLCDEPILVLFDVFAECGWHCQCHSSWLGQFGWWRNTNLYDFRALQSHGGRRP